MDVGQSGVRNSFEEPMEFDDFQKGRPLKEVSRWEFDFGHSFIGFTNTCEERHCLIFLVEKNIEITRHTWFMINNDEFYY